MPDLLEALDPIEQMNLGEIPIAYPTPKIRITKDSVYEELLGLISSSTLLTSAACYEEQEQEQSGSLDELILSRLKGYMNVRGGMRAKRMEIIKGAFNDPPEGKPLLTDVLHANKLWGTIGFAQTLGVMSIPVSGIRTVTGQSSAFPPVS